MNFTLSIRPFLEPRELFYRTEHFVGYTLILPSISVGNVPQLTVDMILATNGITVNSERFISMYTRSPTEFTELRTPTPPPKGPESAPGKRFTRRKSNISAEDVSSPIFRPNTSEPTVPKIRKRVFEHIGQLVSHSDCIQPVVGGNPCGTVVPALSTATDVYCIYDYKIVLVQFRSAISKEKEKDFCQELVDWIKSSKFESVVILSSLFSSIKTDEQLRNRSQVRWVASPSATGFLANEMTVNMLETLGESMELESIQFVPLSKRKPGMVRIPGGGFAGPLYRKL